MATSNSSTNSTMQASSSMYRIELLQDTNWLGWKRRITSILRDRGLLKYVTGTATRPTPATANTPTADELKAMEEWDDNDARAQTQIELTLSDSQMIHISGATTSAQMWKQLVTVKESRGKLGILSMRRRLYRTTADESTDILAHITELREIQEQLHLMGSYVSDDDFTFLLITSLPESWDQFTTAYLGANFTAVQATSNLSGTISQAPTSLVSTLPITSYELIAIILEENRRRLEKTGADSSLVSRGSNSSSNRYPKSDNKSTGCNCPSDSTCSNCGRKYHCKHKCFAKGGGREGQGPDRTKGESKSKGKDQANQSESNQSTNSDLGDHAYSCHIINGNVCTCLSAGNSLKCTDWIADSGTTSHISNSRDLFTDFTPLTNHTIIGLGEQKVQALGKGTITLDFKADGKYVTNILKNVLYTPQAANSLLSISKLDEAGGEASFRNGKCTLTNAKGLKLATANKIGKLYLLDVKPRIEDHANVTSESIETWDSLHKKYGHLSISSLEKLVKGNLIQGLTISPDSPPFTQCEACIQAKQHRQPYPKESEDKTTECGELTHSDIWGPARVAAIPSHLAISNAKYYISFPDDFSRRCTVFFMKHKSEATQCVKDYVTYLENRFKRTPKYIRVDNGREYINHELVKWCRSKGIDLQTTAPYSPSQNGIAERFNRTLIELARAILIARNLPSFLWAEAVSHAAYIRNRSPTRALEGMTPDELWNGRKPNMSHLREFGSTVWILKEGDKPSKILAKSSKHIFVGFNNGPKAIKYWDKSSRQIKVSRNFIFSETKPTEIEIDEVRRLPLEGEPGNNSNQQPSIPSSTIQSAATPTPIKPISVPAAPITPAPTTPIARTPSPAPTEPPSSLPSPLKQVHYAPQGLNPIPLRRSARDTGDHNYRRLDNPKSRLPAAHSPRRTTSTADAPEADETNYVLLASH